MNTIWRLRPTLSLLFIAGQYILLHVYLYLISLKNVSNSSYSNGVNERSITSTLQTRAHTSSAVRNKLRNNYAGIYRIVTDVLLILFVAVIRKNTKI